VTRGQLPQRAGSLGLNGGGTAAAVPPTDVTDHSTKTLSTSSSPSQDFYTLPLWSSEKTALSAVTSS